jgi:transcriptional regulator with XRE-family HTH domain
MRIKIPRSLKASQTGLEKALNAFIEKGLTQQSFATSLGLSRGPVTNFLMGGLVDRPIFFAICNGLGLNPTEIFEPITNVEIDQNTNFKQLISNKHSQLLAWLEIKNEFYLVFKINEEIVAGIYSDNNIKHLLQNSLQNIQADFLDILLNHLLECKIQEKCLHSAKDTKNIVSLSSWLQNSFEVGWQTIEEFWTKKDLKPSFNFRSKVEDSKIDCVKMVKQIDSITKQKEIQPLALVVNLTSKNKEKIDILLQLHPVDKNYLPFGVQLIIIDKSGKALTVATARSDDNWIQQEINGMCGEHFSVQVVLDEYSILEHFVI